MCALANMYMLAIRNGTEYMLMFTECVMQKSNSFVSQAIDFTVVLKQMHIFNLIYLSLKV